MTEQPDKLDLRSQDISEEKKRELLRIFPEIHTEGGKIDFERLKMAMGEMVDVGKERYGMNWPGKADCFKTIQQPSMGTLLPCKEESVDFDTTENMIIEGDNLEVLKLLQKSYLGKIKMIYIDPPYNTGKEFIYPDNYAESMQTYLQYTGQVDSEGKKFSTNTEADGRFHSKWLNMMYPRLYLARNLIRDDGVIFISIDDNEVSNLRKLCDEIFGEENFVESFIWRSRLGKGSTSKQTATLHEYVVCYSKNNEFLNIEADVRIKSAQNKERMRQWGQGDKREDRPTMFYAVPSKEFGDVFPIRPDGTEGRWRVSKVTFNDLLKNNLVVFEKQNNGRVEAYRIIPKGTKTETAQDSILDSGTVKTTAHGSKELNNLFGFNAFDYPKPSTLLTHLVNITTKQDLILDFFAGSGTTAHAVLDLNKQDEGNRKFILVQLPEPCAPNSEAFKAGFKTIAEITKERVRRVIKKLNDLDENKSLELFNRENKKVDQGFRVFKLAESNFKTWNADIAKGNVSALEKQLELHIDHIRPDRSQEDILYEILLKSGFALTPPIEKLELAGMTVFSAAGGTFMICLERELSMGVIEAMAKGKPERVVCLDEGFTGNDQLKANAVQIFKTKGINFKTV